MSVGGILLKNADPPLDDFNLTIIVVLQHSVSVVFFHSEMFYVFRHLCHVLTRRSREVIRFFISNK